MILLSRWRFPNVRGGVLDNAAKPERVIQKGKKLFLQPISREPQFAGEAFKACATIPGGRRLCLILKGSQLEKTRLDEPQALHQRPQ